MVKIGKVCLNTVDHEFYMIKYEDVYGTRLDLIDRIEDYNPMDTSNVVASYIQDTAIYELGNTRLAKSVLAIEHEAASLFVKEEQTVNVIDGAFVMEISKENPETYVKFYNKLVNGVITNMLYKTAYGSITVDNVSNKGYDIKEKPLNFGTYILRDELINKHKVNAKTEKTGHYSYEELLTKYPEVRHVLDNDYVVASS